MGAKCDDEDIAVGRRRRVERLNGCDTVRDSMVVEDRRVERLGQCKAAKRPTVGRMDGRFTLRDVLPADQQYQDVIDAVAVDSLWRGQAALSASRFDSELMHFDVPHGRAARELAE